MAFDPDEYLSQDTETTGQGPAAFNPDEYLKSKGGFDPDAYLGIKKPEGADYSFGKEVAKQVGLGAIGGAVSTIQAAAPQREVPRSLESAISAIQEGKSIEEAAQAPPAPLRPLTEEPAYQFGEALSKRAQETFAPSPEFEKAHPLISSVARGFGSVGFNIGTAALPGGAATIPLQGIGEAAQTAVQKGASPEQQERAARLGTVPGMTDFVDVLLPSLGGGLKSLSLVPRVALRALEGAFVEGGQEGVQQLMQNFITRGVYKPDQNIWEDVPESALVGAIVGGGTSAVFGGHGREAAAPATPEDVRAAASGIVEAPPRFFGFGDIQGLGALPSSPIEGNPQPVAIPPESAGIRGTTPIPFSDILKREGGDVVEPGPPTPQERVAVPTIEYQGVMYGGAIHPDAVEAAAQKLGLSADQITSDPSFREGFVTTQGRFVGRQEAARIAERHGQTESLFGQKPDPEKLYADNLKTMGETGAYDRAFEAIRASQTRVERGPPVAAPQLEGLPGLIPTGVGRMGERIFYQPSAGPARSAMSLHSTTLGEVLPQISLTHLEGKPVPKDIARLFIQKLQNLLPDQAVHIMLPQDMESLGGPFRGAAGAYLVSPETGSRGPILLRSDTLYNPEYGTSVLLHEATHAVTSLAMMTDPIAADRVRNIMAEARAFLAPGLRQGKLGIEYGFTNEREFIAEAFANPEFQSFLQSHVASPYLKETLGLEGKPTLWQSFVELVRRILGMPKTRESYTLLGATLKVGVDIMAQQQRQVEAMQKNFNVIEPQLQAIPRQPETRGVYDMLDGIGNVIPEGSRVELRRQAGYADKASAFYRYMLHAFQLGELNPHISIYQRYLENVRAQSVLESKWNDGAMKVLKDWENIGRAQAEALTGFIDDITNMTYRTQAEVRNGVGRKPTQAEFQKLVKQYGLNADSLKVFQKINMIFDGFLTDSSQLAIREAMKITDPTQRNAAIQAVQARVTALRQRPYFPFMRYGRHVVLVRNAKGVVVHREHFERRGLTSAETFQRRAMERLKGQFPSPQFTIEPDLLSESAAPMVGMPGPLLDAMATKLKLSASQLKAFEQLQFELAPAQSFRHRFQNKSYVKGYSQDFQRSFGQYFFHGAKWLAKTTYADAMRQNVKDMATSAATSPDAIKRLKLRDFMQDHLENNVLDPKQDFLTFKAGLVFWTLGFVPVSAAVNMSQVPMVSLPFLTAKFGPRAPEALLKAMADARNYYKEGTLAKIPSDKARAIAYGIERGTLDQTLGAELAAWAQGGNLGVGYGRSNTARVIHGGMQKAMWMFSIAEKWNRRVTFEAARELALRNPNNKFAKEALTHYTDELASMLKSGMPQHEAEAILVASHVVDQTQFMATPESRPRVMRGKLGTLLLYKRFIQGLVFLTANNKRDFAPLFIPVMLGLAGLGGVPFYDELKDIAKLLGYWLFGKDFDLDREIRRVIVSMTDEQWAPDLVTHGSARIGFGIPWLLNMLGNTTGVGKFAPTVDLSGSIGIGQISPVRLSPLLGPQGAADPKGQFGEQAASALGVGGQVAFNMYKALANKDDPGDFKRWELAMPRFAKNLSQSYRAYSEGMERARNGAAIVRYDTRDPEHLGEILGLAGGFRPERLTAKQEELRAQLDAIKFYDVSRSMLLEQWDAAVRGGSDPREMEKMRTATQEYNSGLPEWARGRALTAATIRASLEARGRTRAMEEVGVPVQRGNVPIAREIQRLYPRATIDVRKVPGQ